MKKLPYLIIALLFLLSCSDVVELDLNNSDPRLVIDARLELLEDGTTSSIIKLTRTADFYVEENPSVTDATVFITEDDGTVHNFTTTGNLGIYTNNTINLQDNNIYTLTIIDQGETYTSSEQLERTSTFTGVEQESFNGFDDEFLQITASFDDPEGLGDFYLFKYDDIDNDQIDIGNDEFIDGNNGDTIFFVENAVPGTVATLRIIGIDQRCYNFYNVLLQQAEDGGNPFAAQPAVVRGNIINIMDSTRYPFGYFRISEVFEVEYTIE